ncbi:MAG: beta-1,3-glucosyltransferase [Bacteroidetes bacterium HGW-Bacteroidetes-1]|nr:MAG: beta-1,3-glucosyltransferase [Bacteroidetes bacterium HGW-Bacteroidetes-1]
MKTEIGTLILLIVLLSCDNFLKAQVMPLYKDASLATELRVQDLLGRMTTQEKFWQLFMIPGDLNIGKEKLKTGIFGFQVASQGKDTDAAGQLLNYGSSISARETALKINEMQRFFLEESRLGIPIIPFDEALHGLIRAGATVFPQSIGLAASFNTNLMHSVASAIAAETKSRGIRQILSPVINIARDVRWGRTEETYGEDPYLTAKMGLAYMRELEKAGVIATPKHFAVNTGDGGRDSYPVHISERLLEEIYFPAFISAIKEAGAGSVMTAYNSLDGSPCTANDWLLNQKLRKEWGFDGFVISDASAVGGANVLHYTAYDYADATKKAIENGLDVIFQTDYNHAPLFYEAFEKGMIEQAKIDSAVARVLRAKFNLGLFEDPYIDPTIADKINGNNAHRNIALMAAKESLVLLKNDKNVLPVNDRIHKIALIGVEAKEARLGGYSGPGNDIVSIYEGLQRQIPAGIEVSYSPGCGIRNEILTTVPAKNLFTDKTLKKNGLLAAYYDNIAFDGTPKVSRTDEEINFGWTLYSPDPSLPFDWFSVQWNGFLVADSNGTYNIGIEGNDGYRLYFDNELIIDNMVKKSFNTKLKTLLLESGKAYPIRIEFFESTGNARFRLVWDAGNTDTVGQSIQQAVNLAAASDLAVVVVGIHEGEFQDRASLALPGRQEELIASIATTGKPLVVVIVGGSAVTMSNWIHLADAIIMAWYPGEAGGLAVAEVLYGLYNPAGRLPITFPMTEGQLPLVYNHKPTGRGDDYYDLTGQPLFPFGYGLSYTEFYYSDLKFSDEKLKNDDILEVSFRLTNSGALDGEEVCQLYLRDEHATVSRPIKELKGFHRIALEAGESTIVSFKMYPEDFSMLNMSMKRIIEPGAFKIMIGSSSKDIRLRGFVQWE